MALNQAFLDSESDRNPTDIDPESPQGFGAASEGQKSASSRSQGWFANIAGRLAAIISIVSMLLFVGGCFTGRVEAKYEFDDDEVDLRKEELDRYEALPQAAKNKALRWAADYDKLEKVQRLIEAGASGYAQDGYGQAPLHWAAQSGSLAVVKFLVEQVRADVNVRTNCCETPLMLAASFGKRNVVKYLVKEAAAELFYEDCCGKPRYTAWDYAYYKHHEDIAELLRKHGG